MKQNYSKRNTQKHQVFSLCSLICRMWELICERKIIRQRTLFIYVFQPI